MIRNQRARAAAFTAVVVISAGHLAARSVSLSRERQALSRVERNVDAGRKVERHEGRGLEAAAAEMASKAKVKNLTLISTVEASDGTELNLEWESDPIASKILLSLLQSDTRTANVRRLSISGMSESPGTVRVRLAAAPGLPAAQVGTRARSVPTRDVFRPLWRAGISTERSVMATFQRESERREAEARRQEEERKALEVSAARDERRRRIQSSLRLSGVANGAQGPVAFIDAGDDHRSVMVRQGDSLEEVRVSRIDVDRGEVTLERAGEFTIELRLASKNAGTF